MHVEGPRCKLFLSDRQTGKGQLADGLIAQRAENQALGPLVFQLKLNYEFVTCDCALPDE
jgi:hypothetical protein